jgi:hypothetical protein
VWDFQHQSRLELQNLKIKTICQTKEQTPHLAKLLLAVRALIGSIFLAEVVVGLLTDTIKLK